MKRTILGVVILALLAGAVAVGIVYAGRKGSDDPKPVEIKGKLSSKGVEFEKKRNDLQKKWNEHQAAFKEKKEFKDLADLNQAFTDLANDVRQISGDTPIEKQALPHFLESLDASQKVASTFIMWQVNDKLFKPSTWEEAKNDAKRANDEWQQWELATKSLTR